MKNKSWAGIHLHVTGGKVLGHRQKETNKEKSGLFQTFSRVQKKKEEDDMHKKRVETLWVPPLLLHRYCSFKPLGTIQGSLIGQAFTERAQLWWTWSIPAVFFRSFNKTLKRYWSSRTFVSQQIHQSHLLFLSVQLSTVYGKKWGRLRGLSPAGVQVVWHSR